MSWQPLQKVKQAYIFWLAARLPTCEQLLPLMSQELDRKLSLKQWIVLRLHNSFCEWCLRYSKQIKMIRDVLQQQAGADEGGAVSDVSMSAEARERMKRMLTEQ